MSTFATALRGHATRARVSVRVEPLAVGGLLLVFAAVAAVCWRAFGDLGRDTGYDLVAGMRVAHGQWPYVDFVYYYGPLAPLAVGLADLIGGDGLGPALVLGILLTAAIVGVTYALARVHVSRIGAFLAAGTTAAVALAPTNFSFVLPHSYSAPLGLLSLLCLLLGLQRFALAGRAVALVAAGASAGAAALTRPEFELAAIVAIGAWLVLPAQAARQRVYGALLLVGPAALVPAVVYGAFLSRVSLHALVLENLYPVKELRQGANAVLRIHAPLTAASFLHLAGLVVVYALGACALAFAGRLLERRAAAANGTVLAVGALLGAATALRPDTARYWLEYVYGWIPGGALVLVAAAVWRLRRTRPAPLEVAWLACVAALAALALKDYASFYMLSTRPQPAVYAIPLAALLLARVHLGSPARPRAGRAVGAAWLAFLAAVGVVLAVHDARAKSAVVHGPGGSLAVAPADAPAYAGALRWIAKTTRPGEPVLVAPQLTALYTLADRTDPLPQLSLLPGALPDTATERVAVRRLEAEHVRLAIIDRHRFTEYGQTVFGGSFDRVVAGWLRTHFVHAATLGKPGARTLDVWVRRDR